MSSFTLFTLLTPTNVLRPLSCTSWSSSPLRTVWGTVWGDSACGGSVGGVVWGTVRGDSVCGGSVGGVVWESCGGGAVWVEVHAWGAVWADCVVNHCLQLAQHNGDTPLPSRQLPPVQPFRRSWQIFFIHLCHSSGRASSSTFTGRVGQSTGGVGHLTF